jgi:hypothetical protein
MSQIRSANTKPELLVRKFLHAQGFRYKLHDKILPGKPDIVLPKHRTVIFIHARPAIVGVVSGMGITIANTSRFLKQEHSGGETKLKPIKAMMLKPQRR